MKDFRFDIQIADRAGNPIAKGGIVVDVVLFFRHKVRYRFAFGTTNEFGLVKIDSDLVEKIRLSNQKFNLMDYNTPLADCDATLEFVVPTSIELEQRIEAARRWFPEDEAFIRSISESRNNEMACGSLKVDLVEYAGARLFLRCDQLAQR